ncbi:MAG: Uma2 family endonuclease, partial [Isosphaeraceae bacterium]
TRLPTLPTPGSMEEVSMSATLTTPNVTDPDQILILDEITWDQYVTISDALVDRHTPRMIYLDGSLTLLGTSRRHDWFAERLAQLVMAVAFGCGILLEDAGQATFRRKDQKAGVEGDKTFYFGPHAEQMLGPVNIDLSTQLPPDLAVEVEVTHPADQALAIWGRLGVPEVWRFNPEADKVGFWHRQADGSYAPIDHSLGLPVLTPADVLDQMRLADALGLSRWHAQLGDWVRDVLVPRLGGS